MMEQEKTIEEEKVTTGSLKEDSKNFVEHISEFLETYYQYISINIMEKTINVTSSAINFIIIAFLAILASSFIGLGLAWWIGDLIKSRSGGFFIVGGFFLLVLAVLIFMRKKLIFPFLRNILTRKIYE